MGTMGTGLGKKGQGKEGGHHRERRENSMLSGNSKRQSLKSTMLALLVH